MLVLAASDIHGNWETYQWLVEVVDTHHPDLVVLAGDLLGAPESYSTVEADQTTHAERLVEVLSPVSVPVLYVMGNDDWIELPPRPGWHSLHLQRREIGEYTFVGYQNTPRFMGGPNERTEEKIAQELSQIECWLDRQTLLVTHGPAYGVLDGGHGSKALAGLLKRTSVRAHIHGHSHQSFGRSGSQFNVAAGCVRRAMFQGRKLIRHSRPLSVS